MSHQGGMPLYGVPQAPLYGVPHGSEVAEQVDTIIEEPEPEIHVAGQPQPTVVLPAELPAPIHVGKSWNEVQTADGRVYYFNVDTGKSQWDKPADIMTSVESAILDTDWQELKIWDGRSYFFNKRTKCSVWSMPPEVQATRGEYTPEVRECIEFSSSRRTQADVRQEFFTLLVERGINDSHTFADAMAIIQDDARSSAIPSDQDKQLFFASYISNQIKQRVHESRDEKRKLFIQAVSDWKEWKGMSESVTFAQMKTVFGDRPWFNQVGEAELRKLFHIFSLEYIEIEKLKKRKLQDALMHEMKNDILSKLNVIDLSSQNAIDMVYAVYTNMKPQPQFWTYLSESQKLIVIKSCISQRIRDMRMAIANKLPMSKEKRAVRQEKDRVKKLIHEFANAKAEARVVKRGQGLTLPTWNTELETFLSSQQADLVSSKDLFVEYVEDLKQGKNPLEGIV